MMRNPPKAALTTVVCSRVVCKFQPINSSFATVPGNTCATWLHSNGHPMSRDRITISKARHSSMTPRTLPPHSLPATHPQTTTAYHSPSYRCLYIATTTNQAKLQVSESSPSMLWITKKAIIANGSRRRVSLLPVHH